MAARSAGSCTDLNHISIMQVGFPVLLISTAIANFYLLFLNAVFWQKNVDVSVTPVG